MKDPGEDRTQQEEVRNGLGSEQIDRRTVLKAGAMFAAGASVAFRWDQEVRIGFGVHRA